MTNPQNTGSEYAEAMRGVLERAAEVEQAKGQVVTAQEPFLQRTPVVLTVFVTFVAVMLFNVNNTRRAPVGLSPQGEEASAQVTVMIATQVVEAYREEHGVLPENLADVGLNDDQFDYRLTDDGHFEMGVEVGATRVLYDSKEGPTSLLRDMGIPIEPPPGPGNR